MKPLLSILIPTLRDRRKFLRRLLDRFEPQLCDSMKLVAIEGESSDNRGPTIGERRQKMIEECDTPYLCFFDDDDLPSGDYCESIHEALKTNPDVVGFRLKQYTDGDLTGLTIHSIKEGGWRDEIGDDGLYRHYRTPNHLNPVRTDLAKQAGFPDMTMGEDAVYSTNLRPLLKTEVFIDKYLYEYFYRVRTREEPCQYDGEGRLTRAAMEKAIESGGSVSFGDRICTKVEDLD